MKTTVHSVMLLVPQSENFVPRFSVVFKNWCQDFSAPNFARGWGKLACAQGGSRLSPEGGGGGGVWEMDTCDRTYVWSSLSAFFFLLCYPLSDFGI